MHQEVDLSKVGYLYRKGWGPETHSWERIPYWLTQEQAEKFATEKGGDIDNEGIPLIFGGSVHPERYLFHKGSVEEGDARFGTDEESSEYCYYCEGHAWSQPEWSAIQVYQALLLNKAAAIKKELNFAVTTKAKLENLKKIMQVFYRMLP